jgi:magnesium-transporting ATPase (P-type)
MQDILREGSRKFVNNCKSSGVSVSMVSGDNKKKCLAVGHQSGLIDATGGYYEFSFGNENDARVQIMALFKEIGKYKRHIKVNGENPKDIELVNNFVDLLNNKPVQKRIKFTGEPNLPARD